jgi:hypothetical protein
LRGNALDDGPALHVPLDQQSIVGAGDQEARDLWRRLHPGADPRALLDSLARRMFHLPLGPALDEQLRAGICCSGTTRISELTCRGGPLDPTRAVWLDESRTPIATCTRE